MKLTKDEAIANHRRKWNWIADETLKQKRRVEEWDFFKAHGIREIPFMGKYCCDYARGNCDCCPIEWGDTTDFCKCLQKLQKYHGDPRGLYALWFRQPNYIKYAELARRIAELPEHNVAS